MTQEEAKSALNTRVLAEISIMVALSAALFQVKLYQFPNGGEITMGSMVPLIVLSLRRGPLVGILAGGIFGGVVFLFEPFSLTPVQIMLDYPVAYGAVGLAGLFKKNPILGPVAGIGGRFISHFLSGLFFFTTFLAGEPFVDAATFSAIYNASYLIPEFIITESILILLLKRGAISAYL